MCHGICVIHVHWQTSLSPIQSLNLTFFVTWKDNCIIGRTQIWPTTSSSFSAKFLSFETLNVLCRWGLRPYLTQIRPTVLSLISLNSAIELLLQWVRPSGTFSIVVFTTDSTSSLEYLGLRPRPFASFQRLSEPISAYRFLHLAALLQDIPRAFAMDWFSCPSDAIMTIRARSKERRGDFLLLITEERISRFSSASTMFTAYLILKVHLNIIQKSINFINYDEPH